MRRLAFNLLVALQAGASIASAELPASKRHFPVDVRRPGMAA
ncbi:MAG TPA: hypothetical protein VM510_03250 [Caulifigura sp.]|nr:hypothetical protein [Caulifigura sp.]